MTDQDIHAAAVAVGATVMGDPHHYIMTAAELVEFMRLMRDKPLPVRVLPPPPC